VADRGWQRGVLRDIGARGTGLVTFDSSQPVADPATTIHDLSPAETTVHDLSPISMHDPGPEVKAVPAADPQSEAANAAVLERPAAEPLTDPTPAADRTVRHPTMTFRVPPGTFGNTPAPEATVVTPPRKAEPSVPLSAPVSTPVPEVSMPAAEPVQAPAEASSWPQPASIENVIGAPEEQAAPQWQPSEPPQQGSVAASLPAAAPPWVPVSSGQEAADALVRRVPHGDPLVRRMGQGVRKAVGASAAGDLRELADVAGRLARPVSTCRQIAVASVRGGAGKTTLAALIGAIIAAHREDRVLAMDADPGLGSLPLRLGVTAERSMHELAAVHPRSWEEVAGYLGQAAQRLWVLSGTTGGRLGEELGLDTFQAAFSGLSRYFSASVIDCGAGILGALQRGVLATAHAQVLVTPATVDGALSARSALDWFAANGHGVLLSRTVIVLVTHTPQVYADLEQVQAMLSTGGMTVIHLPFDRHLATGTSIDLDRIGAASRSAATQIAADVFARSAGGVG
jgi:MinD-like ATPase involved in chromosome partitioning or flagellar assembly